MKRLIIILVLFFVGLVVQAQVKDSTLVTGTNTEKLIDKYTAQFSEAISALATTLKTPVEHVYRVLVTQQTIEAVFTLVIVLFLLIMGISMIIYSIKDNNRANELYVENNPGTSRTKHYGIDEGWWIAGIIIGCIMLLAGVIVMAAEGSNIAMGLFNPEYGALKDIARMIR